MVYYAMHIFVVNIVTAVTAIKVNFKLSQFFIKNVFIFLNLKELYEINTITING